MSPSLKSRSQANSREEVVKTSKRKDGKKVKRRKTTTTKVNGSKPLNAAPRPLETEDSEQKPEPAGDDDHAFFDDEENAAYANFMLSIEPSKLTTFSKKATDGVTVPPTSKTRVNRPMGESATHGETDPLPLITEATTTPTVPDNDSSEGDSATKKDKEIESLGTERLPKKVNPDAKRRRASTPGWTEKDTGPERLPIKTRGGVLKRNARMQSQPPASNGKRHTNEGSGVTNYREEDDASDGKEQPHVRTQDLTDPHGGNEEAPESDPVSEDEQSIYDSADSDGDYSMELDDHSSLPSSSTPSSGMGNGQLHLSVLRQRRLEQKKALMAELCETILGSPEESLMRPKNVVKGEDERPRMEQLFALVRNESSRSRVMIR